MSDAVPLAVQIACVERELKYRERCYPRWVAEHRMMQRKADEELATMRAVLATLKTLQPADLFGEVGRG